MSFILALMFAGYETTAAQTSWTLILLLVRVSGKIGSQIRPMKGNLCWQPGLTLVAPHRNGVVAAVPVILDVQIGFDAAEVRQHLAKTPDIVAMAAQLS